MADVSFSAASDAARRRLGERAYSHSLRVADVAAGLAMVYHADAAKAKVAGVLHDWDREIPTDEMLDRARDMGVEVSDLDQDAPHLLHARRRRHDRTGHDRLHRRYDRTRKTLPGDSGASRGCGNSVAGRAVCDVLPAHAGVSRRGQAPHPS